MEKVVGTLLSGSIMTGSLATVFGKDGKDGFSPNIYVSEYDDGVNIEIETANQGWQGFDIRHGEDGKDYVLTDEDRQEIASRVTCEQIGAVAQDEFAAKVEEAVVAGLQSGEILDGVHTISVNVAEQSLYDAGIVENDENGHQIYHAEKTDNPHQVTAEQVGAVTHEELTAKVEDIITTELDNDGPIRPAVELVANERAVNVLQDYDLIREDTSIPGTYYPNVVTTEQHYEDKAEAINVAFENTRDWAEQEIGILREDIYNGFYTKTEVDEDLAESKAVIVTVSGTTPSHTSQEIYALIQAGKVVYLHLWGNTYIICSACTESEAKFENSVVTNATGADGVTYNVQRFRLYFIKNDRYASPQTIESPSIDYLNAQIAHALGQ